MAISTGLAAGQCETCVGLVCLSGNLRLNVLAGGSQSERPGRITAGLYKRGFENVFLGEAG